MTSRKVVITRPLMKEIFKKYEQTPNIQLVTWENDSPAPRNWIIDNIKDASSVLVMLSDKVDKELLSNANKLKCISTMSVGIDHCDLNILKSLNIKLANTPILVEATSEIAILLYLSAMRRLKESLRFIDNGSWPQIGWGPLLLSGYQSTSKTIGFLGFGRIAQETCRKLSVFGIKNVIYTDSGKHDRTERDKELSNKFGVIIQRVNLESLAKNSDALIILASMSHSGMKHLVNREFLNLMKKSSILINVARGPIVVCFIIIILQFLLNYIYRIRMH